ncbi:MAG: hypothetical protein JEZ07_14810 [Phycisphaerae bacterium]|nr:hypothetical protein [Phycisphaerae bacterium]
MRTIRIITILLFTTITFAADAKTQEPGPRIVQLTITPSKEPTPGNQPSLTVPFTDQIVDNAALYYLRPLPKMAYIAKDNPVLFDKLGEMLQKDINSIPKEDLDEIFQHFPYLFGPFKQGIHCNSCQWPQNIRSKGLSASMPYSSIYLRQTSQIFALKARKNIAEGKYDQALELTKTLLIVSKHIAHERGTIGNLHASRMFKLPLDTLEILIQKPDAPNLYWALATLPDPFFDIKKISEIEIFLFNFHKSPSFKSYEKILTEILTADQAKELALEQFNYMQNTKGKWIDIPEDKIISCLLKYYPQARKYLLANGWLTEKIDNMEKLQISMIYTLELAQHSIQRLHRWFNIPYHQAINKIKSEQEAIKGLLKSHQDLPGNILLSSTSNIKKSYCMFTTVDRRIRALRIIEALKLHVHKTGKLPDSLSQIKCVPIPIDPITGKDFRYKLKNNIATIDCTLGDPELKNQEFIYEIKLRK